MHAYAEHVLSEDHRHELQYQRSTGTVPANNTIRWNPKPSQAAPYLGEVIRAERTAYERALQESLRNTDQPRGAGQKPAGVNGPGRRDRF